MGKYTVVVHYEAAQHIQSPQPIRKGVIIMKTINELEKAVSELKAVSAWSKGVKAYAAELVDNLYEYVEYYGEFPCNARLLEKALLNGASDWNQFSWGGCSLIYNGDIAERLCNPTELKRTGYGTKKPNSSEEWLDTQARALFQACELIKNTCF